MSVSDSYCTEKRERNEKGRFYLVYSVVRNKCVSDNDCVAISCVEPFVVIGFWGIFLCTVAQADVDSSAIKSRMINEKKNENK